MLEIKNKSGIAHKQKLIVGACVVDPGYTGEILSIFTTLEERQKLFSPGRKLHRQF
jgi:dUTPase